MFEIQRKSSLKRLFFSIILIPGMIISLILSIQGCDGPQPSSMTIKIASDFPTRSLEATRGQSLQDGVQMAIDEANRNHLLPTGYKLELDPHNDIGKNNLHDPQVGANNMRQAIADNLVAGIIGPLNSSVGLEELPITNQAPIAQISPSTTYTCLTKRAMDDPICSGSASMRPTGQLTFFRLAGTDDRQGKIAADIFFNQKHYKTVLLVKDDSDIYSRSLAEHFQDEWGNFDGLVVLLNLPEKASSVQTYQRKLETVVAASIHPDLVFFSGNNPNGTYVLQALSNIPSLKDVPFAAAGGIVDDTFLQVASQVHRNAPIYASLPIQDPTHAGTPTGTSFRARYTANHYKNYQPYAASAYDCTMMLIRAIKLALQKGASTPHGAQDHEGAAQFRKAVLQALAHLSYMGATGRHSFDANGDTTNNTISFYQLDLSHAQPDWTWRQQSSE